VDIFPTLCELTGVPIPESVQGKSLVPVLHDPAAVVHDAAFSYSGHHHGLRSDRWAYMRYSDGSEELYDMDGDPNQYTNLANMPAHASVLETFRGQIQQRGQSTSEPPRRKKSRQ
jgi:iduronate 2-sulfatase